MPETRGLRPKVAIVGASGSVGSQIVELIRQRDFAHAATKLFGSRASSTDEAEADEAAPEVAELASPDDLAEFDVAFLALPPDQAAAIIDAHPGPLLIDLSMTNRVPAHATAMVAPGLTPRQRVVELASSRLFAIPHPAAQVIAVVLQALEIRAGSASAAIMLSASSRGREGISALFKQSAELLNARLDLADEETQVGFNVLPAADADELAGVIAAQVAGLIGPGVGLALQIVQVPAFHGSGIALFIPANADIAQWRARLRVAPGIILAETAAASSFVDAAGQEGVITRMTTSAAGTSIWCVFDAARIAALAAIWIAETISG